MQIKPSAAIRQNYNEISELCRTTGEPVYLTNDGEGDLVVMSIKAFERREKMLQLKEHLMRIERGRQNGTRYYSLDEMDSELDKVIADSENMSHETL